MTPDEKALIDARREGYVDATLRYCYDEDQREANRADVERFAAGRYPYPPPPVVWREAVGGKTVRWRRVDGKWQFSAEGRADRVWIDDDWMTDECALTLARCVTEPTVGEGEVEG